MIFPDKFKSFRKSTVKVDFIKVGSKAKSDFKILIMSSMFLGLLDPLLDKVCQFGMIKPICSFIHF